MYIGSEVMTGIAVLLMCLLLLGVIFGVVIISILSGIKIAMVKLLRLYMAIHSKNFQGIEDETSRVSPPWMAM
jgi:hypothetical protein